MQVTLDEMESLFKSLEDIKAETETVIDDLVTRIKTPLDMMFIALQDGRENNQENLSGHKDSATPPFNKGKARISTPQDLEFKNFMKTPIRTARVYKIFSMTKLRLPGEN